MKKLTSNIKAELKKAYQCALEVSILNMKAPLRYINQYIDENVNGFGTAADEKITSREDCRKMVMDSRRQSKGMMYKAKIKTPYRPKFIDETTAVFRDEIVIQIGESENKKILHLWLTSAYKLSLNKWQMVLFHGSLPEAASHSSDTFHLGETEKKVKELEKLVNERTIELQNKNRDLEIEAALETVRSRSLAMHKSDELKEVIRLVLTEIRKLDILAEHAGFYIDYKVHDNMHIWLADPNIEPFFVILPYFDTPTWNSFLKAKAKGTTLHTDLLDFKEKNKFYKSLFKLFKVPEEAKRFYLKCKGLAVSTVLLDNVGLYIENFSAIPYTEEENVVLLRFGKVFQQAYTRFLDLQKAEAQAREAQIEAALEKVRTVALVMKKSDEMLGIAQALYEQLIELGFSNIRNAIIDLHNNNEETFWDYDYSTEMGGTITLMSYHEDYIIEKQVKQIESASDAFFELVLEGNDLQYLIDMRIRNGEKDDPRLRKIKQLTYNLYSFGNGAIGISNFGLLSNEQKLLLKRFRNVFALAYKRYTDMIQAEAQAREAKIEAALEKVRSRTLAMQHSNELSETSAVLFKQLIQLGIAPNRLYICIVKDNSGDAEFWITDEEGSKVSMAYENNLNNNPSFKKMLKGWQQKKLSIVIDMQGKELQDYFRYLTSIDVPFKGGLSQKRRLQYIAYFNQGFIGMATPDEQPPETMELLERFAYVFNLSFTRFHDLKISEAHARHAEQDLIEIKAARKKAEETLSELQATQNQLIQSEKMASLGELTAGIAHEIQNPLNFVNNFSEVSKELLDELKEALNMGKAADAQIIMNDLIQNLEKINHHGKRADDIVKSMLQHSRKSEAKKEPADINALCDEYLRLSYHGLRAKDKSFNAKFEACFDDSLPKINVVPQDIGRVILNLLNNAFYAASQSAANENIATPQSNKTPTVWVSTKKQVDKILISVRDNGVGIPKEIMDKIFQPFFSTKPTGKGTGLGLSLAYDIVKAHGGELKVETQTATAKTRKDTEGTEFIIALPIG